MGPPGLVVGEPPVNSSRATPSFRSPENTLEPIYNKEKHKMPYGTNIGGTS